MHQPSPGGTLIMNDLSRRLVIAATGVAAFAATAEAEPSLELGPILDKYAAALRTRSVEAILRLYTANGSFLAPGSKAAIGHGALRAAYRHIFATLKVDVEFDIQEAAKYAEVGWLRSTSKGRTTVLATGKETIGAFNELVVFQPEGGVWKIRSYAYAPA
jgi:ketosteroid isomerase-like protein